MSYNIIHDNTVNTQPWNKVRFATVESDRFNGNKFPPAEPSSVLASNGSGEVQWQPISFGPLPAGNPNDILITNSLGIIEWSPDIDPTNVTADNITVNNTFSATTLNSDTILSVNGVITNLESVDFVAGNIVASNITASSNVVASNSVIANIGNINSVNTQTTSGFTGNFNNINSTTVNTTNVIASGNVGTNTLSANTGNIDTINSDFITNSENISTKNILVTQTATSSNLTSTTGTILDLTVIDINGLPYPQSAPITPGVPNSVLVTNGSSVVEFEVNPVFNAFLLSSASQSLFERYYEANYAVNQVFYNAVLADSVSIYAVVVGQTVTLTMTNFSYNVMSSLGHFFIMDIPDSTLMPLTSKYVIIPVEWNDDDQAGLLEITSTQYIIKDMEKAGGIGNCGIPNVVSFTYTLN